MERFATQIALLASSRPDALSPRKRSGWIQEAKTSVQEDEDCRSILADWKGARLCACVCLRVQ